MSLWTRKELIELSERADSPAVSLYLPTHRSGPRIRQDRIRLKNQLQSVSRTLVGRGESRQVVEALLAPARGLVGDDGFWRYQSDSLALFLCPDLFRYYRLALTFEELEVVSTSFHLKPLLPLLEGDGRFFVLALSQNRVRLFDGTRDSMTELDLGDSMPRSLADAVGYDWEQRSLQFHTGTGGAATGGGKRAAVFHGQGAGSDDEQVEIEQFLRRLDGALSETLAHPPPPLLLAAAEPLLGTFRKLSGYPRLIDGAIAGNQDVTTAEKLHRQAWPLVEPLFLQERRQSRRRLAQLRGTDRTCEATPEIVRAAHDGRIETLFVPLGTHHWGTFDPESRDVSLQTAVGEETASAENVVDLLDLAAIEALKRGATVYATAAEERSGAAAAHGAAILRY